MFIIKSNKNKKSTKKKGLHNFNRRVLSLSQLLKHIRRKQSKIFLMEQVPMKPIIPPKSFVIILKEKPKRATYNLRLIDYKHCVLLQRYTSLGGKIIARKKTQLSSKNQRFIAKTIKSSRIAALLPFVSKEKGFFR